MELQKLFRKDKQARLESGLANPKTEILQMSYDEQTGECTVQISEPLLLAKHVAAPVRDSGVRHAVVPACAHVPEGPARWGSCDKKLLNKWPMRC
eukprot:COSAG01_NODE_3214_length_6407_cov_5.475428_8_plen_95_part_00